METKNQDLAAGVQMDGGEHACVKDAYDAEHGTYEGMKPPIDSKPAPGRPVPFAVKG